MRKWIVFFAYLIVFFSLTETLTAGGKWDQTKSGCRSWNPYPVPQETTKWTGACEGGKIAGKGKMTSSGIYDGNRRTITIKGTAHRGKLNGPVIMRFWDGVVFRGAMKNSKMVSGRITLPSGDWFEGKLWAGGRHGKGKCRIDGEEGRCRLRNLVFEFK